MVGTATPELVFTVTTVAAQWVHIYGLLRPTDANEDASIAALYVALRRLFHFVVASVDKLLWKLLSKAEIKCLILSASFVWPVLIFGNPFGFA